jgi:glyceraldehyde-3-phosphate dehydrogenase (NAD(P))
MMAQRVRVGVNGYGVIGKRVADAVALQDDMELVGVADVGHDYRIRVALERGYQVFAATPEAREEMATAHVACLCEGFKGAEEPVAWEE